MSPGTQEGSLGWVPGRFYGSHKNSTHHVIFVKVQHLTWIGYYMVLFMLPPDPSLYLPTVCFYFTFSLIFFIMLQLSDKTMLHIKFWTPQNHFGSSLGSRPTDWQTLWVTLLRHVLEPFSTGPTPNHTTPLHTLVTGFPTTRTLQEIGTKRGTKKYPI